MENGKNRDVQIVGKKASALEDYEMYIEEKGNFFTRFLNKIKRSKKQLLLTAGKDEKNGSRSSYDLMFKVTGFKENIFDKFDPLNKKHYIRNNPNMLIMEVIGKNKADPVTYDFKSVIIPQNIKNVKKDN